MAVAVDVVTEVNASLGTHSHAGGTPQGVLVVTGYNTDTGETTAVTYGGQALTRVDRAVDTAGEAGHAEMWFLGSGVPSGTQNVVFTKTGTVAWAVIITLTGSDDLEVVDFGKVEENIAGPSIALTYAGRTCMSFSVFYSGTLAVAHPSVTGGATALHDHDFGSQVIMATRQTSTTSSNSTWTSGLGDDTAWVAAAISEVEASAAGQLFVGPIVIGL